MGSHRQEYWSGLPLPPSGDLPDPGIEPKSPASPAVAGGFFTTEPPGKPTVCTYHISFNLSSGNEHWLFGLFSFLAFMNISATTFMYKFLWCHVYSYPSLYLGVELLDNII